MNEVEKLKVPLCVSQVLGAGAIRTAGLRSISAKQLALSAQCVGCLGALQPLLRGALLAAAPGARRCVTAMLVIVHVKDSLAPFASALATLRHTDLHLPLFAPPPHHHHHNTHSLTGKRAVHKRPHVALHRAFHRNQTRIASILAQASTYQSRVLKLQRIATLAGRCWLLSSSGWLPTWQRTWTRFTPSWRTSCRQGSWRDASPDHIIPNVYCLRCCAFISHAAALVDCCDCCCHSGSPSPIVAQLLM